MATGSKPTRAALRCRKILNRLPGNPRDGRQHHLRDPVAPVQGERLLPEVGEDDADLPPVVRVDRSGRVEAGDAMADRQPAARTDLDLISRGDRDGDAGGYERARARRKEQVAVDGRQKIGTGRVLRGVVRKWQALSVRQAKHGNPDHARSIFTRSPLRTFLNTLGSPVTLPKTLTALAGRISLPRLMGVGPKKMQKALPGGQ